MVQDGELGERLRLVDALLFDLDGTLLENDMDVFLPYYLKAVSSWASHLVEPERFARRLMAATQAMVSNLDPLTCNADAFAEAFYAPLGLVRAKCEPLFAGFYEREFPKLRLHTKAKPGARRALDLACARGYQLVLATNPVFPRAAIEERIRWAGVAGYPWQLITDYESMHFCKPHTGYCREIAARR